jgi:hypothetical protein
MKPLRIQTLSFLLFAALGWPALPAHGSEVRNVVELFTSQGCSSCPPADRLLVQLARDPDILTLSLPVDYWDYIGWKDTFASPGNAARQRAYAAAGGRGQVYTPQVVVNGLGSGIGSDRDAIEEMEHESHRRPGVLAVPLDLSEHDGAITIAIGDAPAGAPRQAGVFLLALTRAGSVSIERGENAGATVIYSNVVRSITKVGDWNGAAQKLTADSALAKGGGADSFAVIVQAGDAGAPSAILAAARAP